MKSWPQDHVVAGQSRLEAVRVNDLAEGVQDGPVVEVEHVSADDGRRLAAVGKRQQPDNAFGLDDDVVVHQQDVVAAVLDGLEHSAGKTAGAAEVGLVDDPQLAAERSPGPRRSRPASATFCDALVDDEDFLDVIQRFGILGEEPQVVEAEIRSCSGS